MGAGIRARGCAGPRLRAAWATGHCAYDYGMPWNRRLPMHALRAMPRVVRVCAVTALLGLAVAACEDTPEPLIATPSAMEVAVMEAAQEAPPSPTAAAAEPAATALAGTPAPTAREPIQTVSRPAAAAPVATASATPSPTPAPPPEPLDDVVTDRLNEAASLIERVTGSPAALRAGPDLRVLLEAAALEFLERYGPDTEAAVRLNYAVGQLPPLVYDLAPQGARIAAADVDGDGQNELVAAWHLIGVPPVWFDQGDAGFIAHAFPVGATAATARSMTFVRSTSDLTDDGVADVLLVSTTPGATTQTEDVRVYTWDDGTPRRVFDVAVVFGSGPAGWELRAATSPAEIETVCPALGHFDAALLPHPGLRRTFGWDGKQFHEVARRLDSPVSRHDQINRGEAAFWAGRYDDAEAAYRAVIETPAGGGDQISSQPDWEGLARLRLAQIGLLKIQAFDRARLDAALERGGAIGLIAQTMQEAVANADPLRMFAALQQLDLASEPPPGTYGAIEFPMEPGLVLALGKALEIGLRGLGASELSEAALVSRLSSRGVEVRRVAVADLNSDGALEAVVSLARHSTRTIGPPVNEFWFVHRYGTRWVAQPIGAVGDGAVTNGAQTVSSGRSVFVVSDSGAERDLYLSFDGQRLDVWNRLPTLHDLYPANPFDGREMRRCEIGL